MAELPFRRYKVNILIDLGAETESFPSFSAFSRQRHVEDHHHCEASQGTERRQVRAAVLAMRFRDQFLDHDVDHCTSRKCQRIWQKGTHG